MQIYVRVVQRGSLSSAARDLGTSPASVSRQVTALENSLGARLLNRTSRKLTLTEAGSTYLRHAEEILQRFDEARRSVSQLERTPRGTLRVHSRILVGQLHIVPAVSRFLLTHPEIKIDLMLSNRAVDLVQGNIDVDVRIGKLVDSTLIARRLALSDRFVCAAPAYLGRRPPIREPQDLLAHNCMTYRLDGGLARWRFQDVEGRKFDLPVEGSLETDYGPALRSAALAGLGLALMPDWSVRDDLRQGTLVRLLPDYKVSLAEFDNGVYAVYQRSRHMSTKVRLFVEHLANTFPRGRD
jgi:DNA-binding transcriptional LysR family regulator